MSNRTKTISDKTAAADPTPTDDRDSLWLTYCTRGLSSKGGQLSPTERRMASDIFEPNDEAFMAAISSHVVSPGE